MSQYNYNSAQTQQIDDLKSYIEEYCRTHEIEDARIFTQYLDGHSSIDPELLKDPAFQAYWRLAFLQLFEILNRDTGQSLSGQVELDFETAYSQASDEMKQFIEQLIVDNPEFMSFASLADSDAATTPEALWQLFETTDGKPVFVDQQARDMAKEFGMGGAYDWLIGTEEGIRSTEQWLMEGLAEMDQQLAELADALKSGEMSADEFKAKSENMSQHRQLYLGMIQNLEDSWRRMMELMSALVKQAHEQQMALLNKWQRG